MSWGVFFSKNYVVCFLGFVSWVVGVLCPLLCTDLVLVYCGVAWLSPFSFSMFFALFVYQYINKISRRHGNGLPYEWCG